MTHLFNQNENVNPLKVEEIIEKFGLYWIVKKEPLLLPDGIESGFFGTVRQDTRQTFAAVKEGYEVFQNHELAELVYRIAGNLDGEVSRGGSFDGGGKVYLQISQEDFKVAGDRIKRWYTSMNSFDTSAALKWGASGTTISCSNTWTMAYKGLQNTVKHTSNMRNMIDASMRVIERLQEADKSLYEVLTQFTEVEAKREHIEGVVKAVTEVDLSMSLKEAEKEYSTKRLNNAKSLMESITNEMSYKGQNLWGLWSGMTHYTTHKAGSDRTREKSKAMGTLASADQAVFEMMRELVYA